MLCNFIEQNAKKCAEYFPMQEGQTLQFEDGVSVTCKRQEPFAFPIETKVRIRVTHLEVNVSGQPPHSCSHYQWIDWPDRGVPEADLAPIALLAKLKENTEPIIVHCSAGIGRTGSIVLIQHAMELLHKNEPLLEVSGYLLELRKQRNNSVQNAKKCAEYFPMQEGQTLQFEDGVSVTCKRQEPTEQQYLYVHQVLLLYLKKAKYLDDVVNPYLEAFTKDYVAATKGF
ncbi:Protein-tyrosine phosphatase [Ancylostoma ceylanicum]|uniref:Protein-tyrosine phosphatase n=1 Tax=Ancylostoma ceylanicum TaxID=53326 RepID=A0A0D6M4G9_9BILA|nr:Protein-tyrosine phosphatase [Ancylostoma ceylanicum]